jgi:hypothetical protein
MATPSQDRKPSWFNTKVLLTAVLAILILMFVFISGVAAGHFSNNFSGRHGHHHMMGFKAHGPGQAGMRGLLGINQNVVSGAVTKVSGSSFTVAGGGTTSQVSTSSSTQYKGATAVKLNDTVVAIGTKNDAVLQATRVIVNPLRGV